MCIKCQLKSKNIVRLTAISYLRFLCHVSHTTPGTTASTLAAYSPFLGFFPTHTYTHTRFLNFHFSKCWVFSISPAATNIFSSAQITAHILFYSGGTENKDINNQIGSRIDPANSLTKAKLHKGAAPSKGLFNTVEKFS